jgi:hypothetical protein
VKTRLNVLCIILLSGIFIIPVAANNSTFFITIDPVGDHKIGNEFLINGTTNLPLNETVSVVIYPPYFCPGGGCGTTFRSTGTIQSRKDGVNTWSCNVSTTWGWIRLGRCQRNCTVAPWESTYIVEASSRPEFNASQTQSFAILNASPTGTGINSPDTPAPPHVPVSAIQNPSLVKSPVQTIPAATRVSPLPLQLPISAILVIVVLEMRAGRKI